MKKYWRFLLTQAIYVIIALSVALILWTLLPEVNEAVFSIGSFRGGGAFAGFAFVWWYLYKQGPIEVAKQAAKEEAKQEAIERELFEQTLCSLPKKGRL